MNATVTVSSSRYYSQRSVQYRNVQIDNGTKNNHCRHRHQQQTQKLKQSYIEKWHESTVKPSQFYEQHAKAGKRQKNYFYSVDLQGRVFLEETLPKNIATSIKSPQFLDFFYKRMKRVSSKEVQSLTMNDEPSPATTVSTTVTTTASLNSKSDNDNSNVSEPGIESDYPFVSPCGLYELNFVRPADSVIVFQYLQEKKMNNQEDRLEDARELELVFAATLSQPFSPCKLALSKRSGRLYHELITSLDSDNHADGRGNDKDAKAHQALNSKFTKQKDVGQRKKNPLITPLHNSDGSRIVEYGLIRSSLAVKLSENIVPYEKGKKRNGDDDNKKIFSEKRKDEEYSEMAFICFKTGKQYPIFYLPKESEPGPWSLPFEEEEG